MRNKNLLFIMIFYFTTNNTYFMNGKLFANPIYSQDPTKTIVLIIDPNIQQGINYELNQFISDLEEDNYNVISHIQNENTPQELREYLLNLYTATPQFQGAIIFGDFPMPFSRIHYTTENYSRDILTTQYFADLDGNYDFVEKTADNEFIFQNHSGAVESEIWVSVIPYTSSDAQTIQNISNYLKKNHEFRTKERQVKIGFIEPILGSKYIRDTPANYFSQIDWVLNPDLNYAWFNIDFMSRGNVSITCDNVLNNNVDYPDAKYSYDVEILTNDYDFGRIGGHGNAVLFTSQDASITIDVNWAQNNNIKTLYIWGGSCGTGNITYQGNGSVCLASTFLYNYNNNVLLYKAASNDTYGLYKTREGYGQRVVGNQLLQGSSFGEALLHYFKGEYVPPSDGRTREEVSAQHILLGDGTLKLQEHMNYVGNDRPYIISQNYLKMNNDNSLQITLNDFVVKDNDNTINEMILLLHNGDNYTIAGNTIEVENGFIGILNVPIQVYDGTDYSETFSLIVDCNSAPTDLFIAENEMNNFDFDAYFEDGKQELYDNLSEFLRGRFYILMDVLSEPEEYNNHNVYTYNWIAYGSKAGVFKKAQKILEIKDSAYLAPSGVSASDGEFTNKIQITWNTVDQAASYEVYRNSVNDTSSAVKIIDCLNPAILDTSIVTEQVYYYWVKAIQTINRRNFTSSFSQPDSGYATSITSVSNESNSLPTHFELLQNYPNPFNAETIIRYQLPKDSDVTVRIFNLLGQETITLMDEKQAAGEYQIQWNGMDFRGNQVSSGIYIVNFVADSFVKSRQILLLK